MAPEQLLLGVMVKLFTAVSKVKHELTDSSCLSECREAVFHHGVCYAFTTERNDNGDDDNLLYVTIGMDP